MKVKEVVSSISKTVESFNEFRSFNSTLSSLRILFSSFWSYQHLITPNIYNLIEQINDFIFNVGRGKIKFDELSKEESVDIQRKILLFSGFFNKFLKDNPQIGDLDIVDEYGLKTSLRPFKLLVVCVANAGRSPVLEQSLGFISENLGLKLDVKSCGIFELLGESQIERTKQPFFTKIIGKIIGGKGIPVTQELCNWADLVLTAAPYISNKIISKFSNCKNKVITAKEFVARYNISEKGFSYAFYIDDPAFSTEQEKALDKWLEAKKGSIKEFIIKSAQETKEGKRKPFLYKRKYPEGETARGEVLSIKELLKLSFAIVERLTIDNYLTAKPEYNSILLFKLEELRKRTL